MGTSEAADNGGLPATSARTVQQELPRGIRNWIIVTVRFEEEGGDKKYLPRMD
jgi:hypothetical protein